MCVGSLWYLDCGYNRHSLYLMSYSQNAIILFLSMFSLIKKIKPISDCSNSNRCVTRFSWKVLIFLCSLRLCPGNSKKALHWWVPTILHSDNLTFLLLFVKNLAWSLSFWLTSLCIMGSSFIHLIRTDSNEFFLMAE